MLHNISYMKATQSVIYYKLLNCSSLLITVAFIQFLPQPEDPKSNRGPINVVFWLDVKLITKTINHSYKQEIEWM